MKKIALALLAGSALTGCMKEVDEVEVGNDFASIAVINASPTATTGSLNSNAFVDGTIQTTGAVTYAGNSGYLSVRPGNRAVEFRAGTVDSARLVTLPGESFESGRSYTYVLYDTVPASQTGAARRVRSFRLTDDLNLSGKQGNAAYVRILHLAPSASAVDVTFLRTNVTPSDSVTVRNLTYVGASPTQAQLDGLAAFNTVLPLGFNGAYTMRVKVAGTQNVVATATANLTTQTINQSFVTVFVTGGVQSRAVSVGVFRHYP